jgi:hypothetical protein
MSYIYVCNFHVNVTFCRMIYSSRRENIFQEAHIFPVVLTFSNTPYPLRLSQLKHLSTFLTSFLVFILSV